MIARVRLHPDDFIWDFHRHPDHLERLRLAATHRFLDDFDRGKQEGRYRVAALPRLPFADGEFRLALVSHLLFLYSDRLDADFHVDSAFELLRVAGEAADLPAADARTSMVAACPGRPLGPGSGGACGRDCRHGVRVPASR